MRRIFKSASKLVLLLVSLGATLGLFTGHLSSDQFVAFLMLVGGYYFGTNQPEGRVVDK